MTGDQNIQIEKIDQLNKHAFQIRASDSNNAFALSNEALELARNAGYEKGLAEALRTQGFCHMRLSKNEEALVYFREAKSVFERIKDFRGIGYTLEGIGIVQRNFGNYAESLNALYQGIEYSQQTNDDEQVALSWYHIGVTYKYMGELEKALDCLLKSLDLSKFIQSEIGESYSLNLIGSIYNEMGDFARAMEYYNLSLNIRRRAGDKWGEAGCLDNIGYTHYKLGHTEVASQFCLQALSISESVGDKKGKANALFHLAEINFHNQKKEEANTLAYQSLEIRRSMNDKKGQAEVCLSLAQVAASDDSSQQASDQRLLLDQASKLAKETKALDIQYKVHHAYFKMFKRLGLYEMALRHLELAIVIDKEIHSQAITQKIQALEIENKIEQSKREAETYQIKNAEIERTLAQLKSTQSQLIQSEKMASLGELTAGIAHEIQNPLNFVNNFSEVNIELINELERELAAGSTQSAVGIVRDIKSNSEKINHHGKRAGDIVKGMLQHSRTSSGQKELTDINALCDEYLRLTYHGLRAKNKSFNAKFETHLDPTLPKLNVVPQDIGRVILNLINNAFYAVNEKTKQGIINYEPIVSVSTHRSLSSGEGRGEVIIKVKDNGNGIPDKIKDKIFQPFFTTKPTGQGTGLGLSLSYDIITKGHGGQLQAESNVQTGSTFIITIPLK